MANIRISPDGAALTIAAADLVAELAKQAIAQRGRFNIALSGGNTPRPVYERLAMPGYSDKIDWAKVQIFFGDERCVTPDDPSSNYHMARIALFDRVPIPAANIHRMRGEDDPESAAKAYEDELRKSFGGTPDGFDLVFLGMGDNGHTASLFPGLPAVAETARWVMAQYVEVMSMWRVTLTPVVINAARHIAFLVSGAGKAEMLHRVIEGPLQPVVLPSQAIKPTSGTLTWLLDQPAAAGLRAK
jgi:6-phosphogluconolactonase